MELARRTGSRDDIHGAIGERLAAARSARGLTQAAVARVFDRRQSYIGKLETGQRRLQFVEAIRLAALYGVSIADFDPSGGGPEDHESVFVTDPEPTPP